MSAVFVCLIVEPTLFDTFFLLLLFCMTLFEQYVRALYLGSFSLIDNMLHSVIVYVLFQYNWSYYPCPVDELHGDVAQ